jgi:hypothetical protein
MPYAMLIGPASYSFQGKTMKRGVCFEVDKELARQFRADDRFKVSDSPIVMAKPGTRRRMRGGDREPIDTGSTTVVDGPEDIGDDQPLTIREAADRLDIDDEDNFDADGKPAVAALSKLMGREVTADQRDKALGTPAAVVADTTRKGSVKVIKKAPAAEARAEA